MEIAMMITSSQTSKFAAFFADFLHLTAVPQLLQYFALILIISSQFRHCVWDWFGCIISVPQCLQYFESPSILLSHFTQWSVFVPFFLFLTLLVFFFPPGRGLVLGLFNLLPSELFLCCFRFFIQSGSVSVEFHTLFAKCFRACHVRNKFEGLRFERLDWQLWWSGLVSDLNTGCDSAIIVWYKSEQDLNWNLYNFENFESTHRDDDATEFFCDQ